MSKLFSKEYKEQQNRAAQEETTTVPPKDSGDIMFGPTYIEEPKKEVEIGAMSQEAFDELKKVEHEIRTKKDGIHEVEEVNIFDLKNINIAFNVGKERKELFKDFNLSIPDIKGKSQVIGFAGPSGCGKSQLLRIISGLSKPQSGEVMVYGKPYTDKTHFPLIFQRYSNYDWMSVYDNLALPLRMKGMKSEEVDKKVKDMIKILGLEGHESKWGYPGGGLSGGQCQRISIGRSILAASGNEASRGNQILLLDEATSALDIVSKHEVHDTLMDIIYNTDFDPTMIIVSHDPSELAYLCDRVYVLAPWPCRIHKVIDIGYPEMVRTRATKASQLCQDHAKEIEQAIREIE